MNIEKHVVEMKNAARTLAEYSYPNVSKDDEKHILCLRERELFIDGYDVIVVFSENNYDANDLFILQMYASYGSFLPFSLVCKVAEKFLGSIGLYYVSIIQNDRKIYIWTLCTDKKGKVLDDKSYMDVKEDEYNGFKFMRVMSVDNSKFF